MSSYEWCREQLADVEEATRSNVLALLTVWERMVFPAGDPRRERVLTMFSDLVHGIAIEKEDPDSDYEWVSALLAKPRQKDRIRVKRDAFSKETGKQVLNGKEGIVARVSRGTLVIAIENEGSTHITPDKLETRVPKQV